MSAQDLWDAAAPMIKVTEKHPFLVAMVDGTLDEASFKYYVTQDALYLQDFADCLRRLAKNAPCAEDTTRLTAFATGAEEAEMSLHNSFFKQWNIDANGATQMPNCLLYTSYVKRIVATESHAQGLACMLPCFWVYMHVGKCMLELRKDLGTSVERKPQYDAWIDMYGGEDFEKEVKDYIKMVDKACESVNQEEFEAMKTHFLMTCKMEHMFWDQATLKLQWPVIGGQ